MKANQKIYILDDDRSFLKTTNFYIENNSDYEVEIFDNEKALFEQLTTKTPDLIILDYHLTVDGDDGTTGGDILKQIRFWGYDTPVIMLSSLNDVSKAVNLLKGSATDFISKGESAHEMLLDSIKQIFSYTGLIKEQNTVQGKTSSLKRQLLTSLGLITGLAGLLYLVM